MAPHKLDIVLGAGPGQAICPHSSDAVAAEVAGWVSVCLSSETGLPGTAVGGAERTHWIIVHLNVCRRDETPEQAFFQAAQIRMLHIYVYDVDVTVSRASGFHQIMPRAPTQTTKLNLQ